MKIFFKIKLLLIFFTIAIILGSCQNTNNNNNVSDKDTIPEIELDETEHRAKMIIYSLPSPVETACILEQANVNFKESLLNKINNYQKYNTTVSKSVNLGIYIADMSYLSLFDQQQLNMKYMMNVKKLADDIGVIDLVNEETIKKLEENMNNKDVILSIISETMSNSNNYLELNNRQDIAALVILGGWIEGIYIACNLVEEKIEKNVDLAILIAEQKYSVEDLEKFLSYFDKNEDIVKLHKDIIEISKILKNTSDPMAQNEFDQLKEKVNNLRASYIK